MKKLLGIVAVCVCFSFTHLLGAEEATIYIYRTGQFTGAGSNWAMYLDSKKICKLSNNKFIKLTVSKGKHSINSQVGGVGLFKKETVIEIDAEGGRKLLCCLQH
jgi:hypothetical protein